MKSIKKALIGGLTSLILSIGCAPSAYNYTYPEEIENTIKQKTPLNREKNLNVMHLDFDSMTWEEVMNKISTPQEARIYVNRHLKWKHKFASYFDFQSIDSFKKTHERGNGMCMDIAVAAAATLEDDGYEPLLLLMDGDPDMWGNHKIGHGVYLYKENDKFKYIEKGSRNVGFETIDELIKYFNLKNFKKEKYYTKYQIININKLMEKGAARFGVEDYTSTDKNLLPHLSTNNIKLDVKKTPLIK